VRRVGFMITRLRAENFKSWKDTGDLRLGRLTGLFGTNSSGKTSILQILPLLKQTAEFPDSNRVLYTGNQESPVYLGTLPEIIHGHRADGAFKLSVTWAGKQLLFDAANTIFDDSHPLTEISFRTSILWGAERPTVDFFEYDLRGERLGMRRTALPDDIYELTHDGEKLESLKLTGQRRERFLPPPIKCSGFPPGTQKYFEDITFPPALQLAFENFCGKVHYLGPLRSYPQRVYEWGGEKPLDTGWDGEQAIPALLASKTVTQVAEWLKQMGLIHSFRVQPVGESRTIYQCHVKITPTATEVLLPDVGFGVSQILPVLANCAMLPGGSTLLLEQPEIHLHPFAQAALADALIDAIKNRNIQIIVESHSEHLLRRIQRRIARRVLEAEDTALYFCQLENGTSAIEELDVDSYGNIRNWPKDFFGDEMGELADMTVAAMERQKAGRK
jgi:predicted ATPase